MMQAVDSVTQLVPIKMVMPNPPILNKDASEYTEAEKMVSSMLYDGNSVDLRNARCYKNCLLQKFNTSDHCNMTVRRELLLDLLGKCGSNVYIEPPFYCDYGGNIELADNVYMNFNCTILDGCKVKIGARTLLAPNVSIYTATHPVDPIARRTAEYAKPVTIGEDCWIGGCAVICPGITIGNGVTVGAGAVVTKDIESYVVVAGNPARIIKRLEQPNDVNK